MNVFGSPLVGIALSAIKSISGTPAREKPHFRFARGNWYCGVEGELPYLGETVEKAYGVFLLAKRNAGMPIAEHAHGKGDSISKNECHGSGSVEIVDPAQSCEVSLKSLIDCATREQLHELIGLAKARMDYLASNTEYRCSVCGSPGCFECIPF